MARTATITMRQTRRDEDYKAMIRELIAHEDADNPYRRQSESDVVKMLLERVLPAEYERVCKRPPPRPNRK